MLYIFNRWLCYAPRQSVIDIKRTPGGWKEERALAFWQATPALIDMEIAVSLRERRTMSIFPSLVNYQIRCSETINIIESCSVSYMNWWNWSKIMRDFANRKRNFHLFPLNVSINYIYTFNIVCSFRCTMSRSDLLLQLQQLQFRKVFPPSRQKTHCLQKIETYTTYSYYS